MSELQSRLQAALGPGYSIVRELGGGGMSRVFLAEDVSLRRQVVVKVLPPEMGAGINAERFQREVQLAASLQHPHIVPVLSAGANDDLRYYLMPFVEGESLRARLARQHELPVADAVSILRDVLDALDAAHKRGVVHRDIKPDNILLSGRHAVITDFGVSKALTESTQGSPLTSLGVALGTPAYMAPEQAAGDPSVDYRADLYAVGALAYEMLSGRPPFQATSAQQMLSAHLTQQPEPVTAHRASVPEPLATLVMRCLEKKPADRPQSADELLTILTAVPTLSGGVPLPATELSTGTLAAIGRHHPVRLALISALTPLGLIGAFFAVRYAIGLPVWATTAALALAALAVPVLILTGRAERRRLLARVQHTTPVSGTLAHFTWRRSIRAGVVAFALLVVATAVYLAMRAYGIGSVGTLMAKGLYDASEPILLADFANSAPDSTLGVTVTELVRLDFEQSRVVKLFGPEDVRAALGRMKKPPKTALSLDVARELARRENLKAVLVGEVTSVGGGLVVAARLIDAESGETLVARRETAASVDGVISAVDRLSAGLRERVGESLRAIQREAPIEAVTTSSFEALQAFALAARAGGEGDYPRALTLLRRATAIDSNFAEAYRKRGTFFANQGFPRDSIVGALSKAYALRGQLPPVERKMVEASYQWTVLEDLDGAAVSFREVLDLDPDHAIARHNFALLLTNTRQYAAAREVRAFQCSAPTGVRPTAGLYHPCLGLAAVQIMQGAFDDAERSVKAAEASGASEYWLTIAKLNLALARGQLEKAEQELAPAIARWLASGAPARVGDGEWWLMQFAYLHGRDREARLHRAAWEKQRRVLNPNWWPEELTHAFWQLGDDIWYRRPMTNSHAALVAALPGAHLEQRAPENRGSENLAVRFALAGDTTRAREFLDRFMREATDLGPKTRARLALRARGYVAISRGEVAQGIALLREWEQYTANPLNIWQVAQAYDRSSQPDSAEALYRRFLEMPANNRGGWLDAIPFATRRVGELADARGDRETAKRYYAQFVELWKDADPELQMVVRRIRARLKEL